MPFTKFTLTRFRLLTLLVAVALCAGIFAVVRLVLNPPVPTTLVEGRVVFGYDGSPAGSAVVHAQMVTLPDGQQPSVQGRMPGDGRTPRYGKVIADMSGRYTMPKMEAGTYNIWAVRSGFTVVALDRFLCDGTTTVPDLSLVRGGIITGRVVDANGQPAKHESGMEHVGLHGPSRPKSGAAIEVTYLQDDGTFFIRAAPGRNLVSVPWSRVHEPVWVEVVEGQTVEIELKASTKSIKPETGH